MRMDLPEIEVAYRLTAREAGGPIHVEALVAWEKFRKGLGAPLVVVSGYRSPAHNAGVGGSPTSQHMLGRAFDIHCPTLSLWDDDVFALAVVSGFRGIGREANPKKLATGGFRGRFHLDVRTGEPAFWRYTGEGFATTPDVHARKMFDTINRGV